LILEGAEAGGVGIDVRRNVVFLELWRPAPELRDHVEQRYGDALRVIAVDEVVRVPLGVTRWSLAGPAELRVKYFTSSGLPLAEAEVSEGPDVVRVRLLAHTPPWTSSSKADRRSGVTACTWPPRWASGAWSSAERRLLPMGRWRAAS
jgi:hypothetical protein